jgi:hypothetical protein
MSIEAMKQALAKFEHLWEIGIDAVYRVELLPEIQALRQAIAQAEQVEPVAWMTNSEQDVTAEFLFSHVQTPMHNIPLYEAPPKREWVGLTDDDVDWILGLAYAHDTELVKTVETKLKDKNG